MTTTPEQTGSAVDPVCLRCGAIIPAHRRVTAFVNVGTEFPAVLRQRWVCPEHTHTFTPDEAAQAEAAYQLRMGELCTFLPVVELIGTRQDTSVRVSCGCCPDETRRRVLITAAGETDRRRVHDPGTQGVVEVYDGAGVLVQRWNTRADLEDAVPDVLAYLAEAHDVGEVAGCGYRITTTDRRADA